MANPLAYWASSSVTKEKSFITMTPGVDVTKSFFPSHTKRPNKLECSSPASLFSQVLFCQKGVAYLSGAAAGWSDIKK